MPGSWNADLTVTATDAAAQTFTATADNPEQIAMQQPWLADHITVTVHLQNGAPMPVQPGDTVRISSRVA